MSDELSQLTLFMSSYDESSDASLSSIPHAQAAHEWWVYIDGASRSNPGLAGAGMYIVRDGAPLYQEGYFLGTRTNNQAEYLALVLALFTLKRWYHIRDKVHLFSDSQLLVRQVQGMYKVRNEQLRPLHAVASQLVTTMHVTLTHVMREDNTHADKMANHGIDTKKTVPPTFIRMLEHHGIPL